MSKALFVAIDVKEDHKADIAAFLREALSAVVDEPETRNWYALHFATGDFAIFDTFPDVAAQLKHLFGKVGRSLLLKSFTEVDGFPGIHSADLIAAKPALRGLIARHALYVPLKAQPGKEKAVADFLSAAVPMVIDEPGTAAWYALDFGGGNFAIFDVFADSIARDAHLAGPVAAALIARANELLAHPPEIRGAEVLAAKTFA